MVPLIRVALMEKCLTEIINLARIQIGEIMQNRDLLPEDMSDLFFLSHTLDECLSKRAEVRKREH